MNVFELSAKLGLDKSEYDSGLNEAESSASSVGSKIGSALSTAGKVVGTAAAAAATGVVALTTSAVENYSNYEQLVGGVETLFGAGGQSLQEYANSVGSTVSGVSSKYSSLMTAQNTVLENAANAYKTAGMSANTYMDTVTSFSASLISSLGGDTEKAAAYANIAITDMSDNANKMGTDISLIQNAYQGLTLLVA